MNEIILFEGQDVKLEVNMKDDTKVAIYFMIVAQINHY